jgi:acyl carrier protein
MDISRRVREFILSNFYVTDTEGLSDGASLLSLGIVDSTGILEVICFLEEEFAIVVEDEDATPANLESIERIATFVSRKVAERLPEPMRQTAEG